MTLHYTIAAADPHAHLFETTLRIDAPDPEGQRLALPAWIPGSYMIREFARHVVSIDARSAGRAVRLRKLDKHTWQAARCTGPIEVRCTVYAWDLSVRAAHLDDTHAFFNGTSVFLRALGHEAARCELEILAPAGEAYTDWKVATAMAPMRTDARGFGLYAADDYDELVDHPVEIGTWAHARFKAGGVEHEIALTGRHEADLARLATDLRKVCATQIRLFEPRTARAPVRRYVFLLTVTGDGYGGLEHRASTALLAPRANLPWTGMESVGDGYRQLLGLASHEYFHTWHVKRIRPAALARYDYDREQYTRLLWVFEGFTSYYDDLTLVRAGLIDAAAYLQALADTIGTVLRGPGRLVQSVAESSFDAWIKYYRQDENSPNAVVSYYAKGALVALALDLAIRQRTGGSRSLDDVMRLAWQQHGRGFFQTPGGIDEDAMPALVAEATGLDLRREIAQWAYGTADLPLAPLLEPFGVTLAHEPAESRASLGARAAQRNGELVLSSCLTGGPAQRAGLSAGDVLVALDGVRASEGLLKTLLVRSAPGRRLTVTAFRRDELRSFDVKLGAPEPGAPSLRLQTRARTAARRLLAGWLGTPPS